MTICLLKSNFRARRALEGLPQSSGNLPVLTSCPGGEVVGLEERGGWGFVSFHDRHCIRVRHWFL